MRPVIVLFAAAFAACSPAAAPRSVMPRAVMPHAPTEAPARDLASARPRDLATGDVAVNDPRVIDLDIIRVAPDADSVSTAALFDQATAAAKAGDPERAIGMFRKLADDFPDSRYAPTSLFDIGAILDHRGDVDGTIAVLRELVQRFPRAAESVQAHLYVAALLAEHSRWAEAKATLEAIVQRTDLTYAERVEAFARLGYVLEATNDDAGAAQALDQANAEYQKAPRLDDPYYIAMATYYQGELAHRRFTQAPVRLPDDTLIADLEHKRALAVEAYDRWKACLGFHQPYWVTAAGYQMSQIFVELWQATVGAPVPETVAAASRGVYVAEVHARVREHLEKALEGHRMNVAVAKAYGVSTTWSEGSRQRAAEVEALLASEPASAPATAP